MPSPVPIEIGPEECLLTSNRIKEEALCGAIPTSVPELACEESARATEGLVLVAGPPRPAALDAPADAKPKRFG